MAEAKTQQPTPNWRELFNTICVLQWPLVRKTQWAPDFVARPQQGFSIARQAAPDYWLRIRFLRP
jgi:hypothetical protein